MLGFKEDEAEAIVDFGETRITSLTPLGDGRLAFLTGRSGQFQLRFIDGNRIQLVEFDRSEFGDDELTGITAGPDGQLLATFGSTVALIDVDTGETEVLTDLEIETWPGSMTLSGDDLLFIADERLWRKPDVVG